MLSAPWARHGRGRSSGGRRPPDVGDRSGVAERPLRPCWVMGSRSTDRFDPGTCSPSDIGRLDASTALARLLAVSGGARRRKSRWVRRNLTCGARGQRRIRPQRPRLRRRNPTLPLHRAPENALRKRGVRLVPRVPRRKREHLRSRVPELGTRSLTHTLYCRRRIRPRRSGRSWR